MKTVLVLAASLVLAAAPAAAQEPPAPTASTPQQSAVAQMTPAPSIVVRQDEVRQRVAAMEAEREAAQVGSRNWWYTVAAVVVGITAVLLAID